MAVHVLYLYHTLPWLRAVLYEYSCTVILIGSYQYSGPVQLYRLYLVLPNILPVPYLGTLPPF